MVEFGVMGEPKKYDGDERNDKEVYRGGETGTRHHFLRLDTLFRLDPCLEEFPTA